MSKTVECHCVDSSNSTRHKPKFPHLFSFPFLVGEFLFLGIALSFQMTIMNIKARPKRKERQMKRTANWFNTETKQEELVTCTSTGKKCNGETVWVDKNGTYFFCKNNGRYGQITRNMKWRFCMANQEYVKANMK